MAEGADALLGRRGERCVDKERAPSPFGCRDTRGELGRRSTSREPPELIRGEEVRVGSLKFRNGIPRKTVTCVALGSSASESHGGSGTV